LKLSATTEYCIEQALPSLAVAPPRGAELWLYLQETLLQPHAAEALRAMHSLRLLTLLLPELKPIDSLVVRDFYHRFTVDEHSILAIESLHRLNQSNSEWDKRYAELLGELEDPELLYLALLLHDTGKGVPGGNHVEASLEIAARCLDRLDVDPQVFTPGHVLVLRDAAQEPSVQRIFVNAAIKKALCREAKGNRSWLSKVRPMYGHDYHFHIRIKCPPGSTQCESQPEPSDGEGCGAADLAYWFRDEVIHPKPPTEPPKPKPPMTLAQLPAACRQVLAAPDAKQ